MKVNPHATSAAWEPYSPYEQGNPKINNHGRHGFGHLFGQRVSSHFGVRYESNSNLHALTPEQYTEAFSTGEINVPWHAFVPSLSFTGFESEYQLLFEIVHPDFRMIEVGFIPVKTSMGFETVPLILASRKNGTQAVGIDSHSISPEAYEAIVTWFPADYYEANIHIARDVDSDGHWFYHHPASGDPATFSLPGGEVLGVDLKQNPKNTSIPRADGKWGFARRGLRVGNTMGHSIDHLLPGIYANKFEGAKNPRVTSDGKPIKILKVLGLVPVAGEMSQNVFALSDEHGTWKVVGNSPEGYPILEETIVRTNDGIEKTFQKKWQPDTSALADGKLIYYFQNGVGRQEVVYDMVGSNSPGYEQRELRLLVWSEEGDHQILKQTASLEFQSSLPDQRFGKVSQQFSTRFIVKQNGHTTFFGNAVSSSALRQNTLSIFPQAPRPASLRPMKSEMRWNEGEASVTTDGTMMPKRVEVFEKYPPPS